MKDKLAEGQLKKNGLCDYHPKGVSVSLLKAQTSSLPWLLHIRDPQLDRLYLASTVSNPQELCRLCENYQNYADETLLYLKQLDTAVNDARIETEQENFELCFRFTIKTEQVNYNHVVHRKKATPSIAKPRLFTPVPLLLTINLLGATAKQWLKMDFEASNLSAATCL